MAKLGRPRIEPSEDLINELTKINDITIEIHAIQERLMHLAEQRRMMVKDAKANGATHRAIYEYGGAYVRSQKAKDE